MQRPRFSEILFERRRELGLSLKQASNALKLSENVLQAFEAGDFPAMPKSGYAQGMIASYARYLGLSSIDIVNQFQYDLSQFENMVKNQVMEPSYQVPGDATQYPLNTNSSSLLQEPTVLGTTQSFSSTSNTYTRRERWQQSSPLVNMYNSDSTFGQKPLQQTSPYSSTLGSTYGQGYYQSSNYNDYPSSQPSSSSSRRRTARNTRRMPKPQAQEQYSDVFDPNSTIVSRRLDPSQYRDDLTYDNNDVMPYTSATKRAGRSTANANVQRPRVSRRSASRSSLQERENHKRVPQKRGVAGAMSGFFANRQRVVFTIFAALVIVLFLIIVLSIKSCTSKSVPSADKQQVAVTTTTPTDADKKKHDEAAANAQNAAAGAEVAANSSTDKDKDSSKDASSDSSKDDSKNNSKEVKVKVSLPEGQVAWVEITVDGKAEVANQKTGPWTREFTVTKSMVVSTNNTKGLSVEVNGQAKDFDKKAGGVGTITIDGPQDNSKNADSSKGSKSSKDSSSSNSSANGNN